jgi:hypothetical protein
MGHEIIFISLGGSSICFLCKWMGHEIHIACLHSIHTITSNLIKVTAILYIFMYSGMGRDIFPMTYDGL